MKYFVDFDEIKQRLLETGRIVLSDRALALELGICIEDAKRIVNRDFVGYNTAVKIARRFPDSVYIMPDEDAHNTKVSGISKR